MILMWRDPGSNYLAGQWPAARLLSMNYFGYFTWYSGPLHTCLSRYRTETVFGNRSASCDSRSLILHGGANAVPSLGSVV